MPLAPVADTAQLNEGDKAILPPTLAHGSHRLIMGFNQGLLTIVWRKALAIIGLIPVTGALNTLVEPIWNILMAVLARHIQYKAQNQMLAFFAPTVKLIGLLNGFKIKLAFLWFQLLPGHIHIEELHISIDLGFFSLESIAHEGIA